MSILAPMVRLGTLPLRLLALERGAELVYSEEIVDAKLAKSARSVDERLGTVDWRVGGGIVLRTCKKESGRLVVQLGTADVQTALLAVEALAFAADDPLRDGIVGLDVNMGCPKKCAVSGGSGSALFADAERAEAIVRALRKALPPEVALSCKVRLHQHGPEETLRRCLRLVAAGASTIAVHARHAGERSCDLARWSELRGLVAGLHKAGAMAVLNGDVLDSTSASMLRSAVAPHDCMLMVGRGALHASNGLFANGDGASGDGAASTCSDDEQALDAATLKMASRYAQLAIDLENPPLNTAFVLQWMLHARMRERHATMKEKRCGELAATATQALPATSAPLAPPAPSPALPGELLRPLVDEPLPVPPAPSPAPPAPSAALQTVSLTVDAVAAALRGASTLSAIATALQLSAYLSSRERGTPAAPTHRYTPGYFDALEGMSDWAKAPCRAALREAHDAAAAFSSGTPEEHSNADFRRLVQARSALAATAVGARAEEARKEEAGEEETNAPVASAAVVVAGARAEVSTSVGAVDGSAAAAAGEDEAAAVAAVEEEHDSRKALLALVGPSVRLRFFVIREAEAAERALGFFARAWQCRVVVAGRPFDGSLRKSKYRAEQDAAKVALAGLAVCPLRAGDVKRRAMRDAKRKAGSVREEAERKR